jgi:hypothetical protein
MGEAIATALAAFQSEMPTVAKGKTAKVPTKDGGSYSYAYADLAAICEATMPLLTKHGLSFTAQPRGTDHGYELVGVLLHTSGEQLDGALPLFGNSPQQIGSAITYARRYLYGCLTGIVTDADDDGQAAQGHRRTERPPQPMLAKTRGHLFALFSKKGIDDPAEQLAGINAITGASYTSRGDLTEEHAQQVIAVLKTRPDKPADTADPNAEDDPWRQP